MSSTISSSVIVVDHRGVDDLVDEEEERRIMLTSVGHDLRTPLAALQAAIEALTDGVAPDPPRYLRSMAHDVAALSSLVDDLFLLSRIEAGRLELLREPIDLTELVDDAVESLRPTAASNGIDLRLVADKPVRAEVNPAAIGRVIRNLLDNAIDHAPRGSIVEVEVRDDGHPVVRVIDTGAGFPDDFAASAFDRFTRAEPSRNRANGGAGLGLAIARGLVEAHGGVIEIEPSAAGGRIAMRLR